MKNLQRILAFIVASVIATACWAPEKFDATLAIDSARHYTFTYDGTVAYGPALAQIAQEGQWSPSGDAGMLAEVAALRRERGIVHAEYAGRGRIKIVFRESGVLEPGKKLFLDLIRFDQEPNGGIRITGDPISPENRQQINQVGLKLDGTIRLTSAIPPAEHNAESTPWFGGLFGSYKWHVTANQQTLPTVVIR